jgi:hypothetical protein
MDIQVPGCALTPQGHVVSWTTWRGPPGYPPNDREGNSRPFGRSLCALEHIPLDGKSIAMQALSTMVLVRERWLTRGTLGGLLSQGLTSARSGHIQGDG